MKKAKLRIAAVLMAVSIGIPAKAVFAAAITITQEDFAAACTTAPTKGITCNATDGRYTLAAGDYVLGGNVDLGTYNLGLAEAGDYSLDLGGHTLTTATDSNVKPNAVTVINAGKTTAIKNGKITNTANGTKALAIGGATATLTDVILTSDGNSAEIGDFGTTAANVTFNNVTSGSHIEVMGNSTLTINSGTYSDNMQGAISTSFSFDPVTFEMTGDGGHLIINGGIFTSEAGSAIYANGIGEKATVEINGGTFTSEADTGLEVLGAKSVVITGGTFTGLEAGLRLADYNNVVLSGGTFKALGTEAGNGAVTALAENTDILSKILASGYKYTDATATMGTLWTEPLAYLTNKNVSVVSDSTEETIDLSTIGSPNSGASTKGSGSATTSTVATLGASAAVISGLYLGKKHLAKKSAK